MTIRKCKEKDLEKVNLIEQKSFKHPYPEKDMKELMFKNPLMSFYVIEDKGEVVGFILFLITFNSATIFQIAIEEKMRNKGYGQLLFNEMEKIFSEQKDVIEACTLEVRVSNEQAINFYKKNGFKHVVYKKQYYSNGEDADYMVKYYL